MKSALSTVILFASGFIALGQTNLPVLFAKASDKPKLPIVSPEKRIARATIRQLNQTDFERRVATRGLPLLKRVPKPVGNVQKIVNAIDLTNGEDGEMIQIQTVSFGQGNAKTVVDRVDLFESRLSRRTSISYPTLLFESPGKEENVSFLFTLNFKF